MIKVLKLERVLNIEMNTDMFERREDRFWEIDVIRGIAVLMMITFHTAYDIYFFGEKGIDVHHGLWLLLARATATLFILLVGISLTLSYQRIGDLPACQTYKKYIKRGAKIFSWGMIITLITWIFFREAFIVFGILHFIGISIILSIPLIKKRNLNLVLGLIIFLTGFYLNGRTFDFSYLLWLGFKPNGLYTLDYFPLLPWFGLILIGIFLGNTLYPDFGRKFELPDLSEIPVIKQMSMLGKNSLFIYLLHQPLLIIFLHLLGIISFSF